MMPIAGPIVAGRAWLGSLFSARKSGGRLAVILAVVLPLVLVTGILLASMQQPQQKAFQLLKDPPATTQQAQALLQHEEEIRAGLLNSYLASFRYISSVGEVRHINDMYRGLFNISAQSCLADRAGLRGLSAPVSIQSGSSGQSRERRQPGPGE